MNLQIKIHQKKMFKKLLIVVFMIIFVKSIRFSEIVYEVFAAPPKGTKLGWYRGNYLTEKDYEKTRNTNYVWKLDTTHSGKTYVDARPIKSNNKLRYVNGVKTLKQRKRENIEVYQYRGKIWYKTCKKIKKDKELFVDYGDEYF